MADESPRPLALVADDNHLIRRLVGSLLRTDGFDVVAFPDGREVMASHDRKPAALLVLDVMTPGVSGVDIVRSLRQQGDTVPTVLMSRFPLEKVEPRLRELARVEFLQKPFGLEEFGMTVSRVRETVAG